MNEAKRTTLEQIKAFLKGTEAVECSVCGRGGDCYDHIGDVLRRFRYGQLGRADKGVILRYLERTTGYSRQQITRLVKRWRTGKKLIVAYRAPTHGLVRKFTDADIALLAESVTYPNGRTVDYARNALGHVQSVATTGSGETQTLATNIIYAPFGPLSGLTFGNGIPSSRELDQDYRSRPTSTKGCWSKATPQMPRTISR